MPMLNHISSSIRHHLRSLHVLEDLQGHFQLEGLLAGTDEGTIGDLVGGIPTPLKNMRKSVGIIIPNIWKN